MIVTCESCDTSFSLDDRLVKPTGSKVRCSKCAHVFKIFPPESPLSVEPLKTEEIEGPKTVKAIEAEPSTENVEKKFGSNLNADALSTASLGGDEGALPEGLESLFEEITSGKAEEKKIDPIIGEKIANLDDSGLSELDQFLSPMDSGYPSETGDINPMESSEMKVSGAGESLSGLEFEDLDLGLDPETHTDEIPADDLQLGLDLDVDLENGTEITPQLKRPPEKGGEVDLSDLDLSELDLFFEGKGRAIPDASEKETPLVGMDLPSENDTGFQGDMVFDLADLELELESAGTDKGNLIQSEVPTSGEVDFGESFRLERDSEKRASIDDGIDLDDLERMIQESSEDELATVTAPASLSMVETGSGNAGQTIGAIPISGISDDAPEVSGKGTARSDERVFKPTPKALKKGKSRVPLLLLILVLLIAAGAYVLTQFGGLNIPFLDMLKPAPTDPTGSMHIQTSDFVTKFVENQKEGRLFVISGKVINQYPNPHGLIRVKADLFTKGQAISQTRTVSCGNVLTDVELTTLDMASILKRLENQSGDNKSNLKLEPGKSLPFMIVFSKLPEKLEEFALEVVGSSPAS